jgi:transcriptional regulator with XRE-family HTH domain
MEDPSRIVRARRKQLHLTQQEAADLAGCTWKFVFDVEQGKETVRFDKWRALLEAFGLKPLETAVFKNGIRVGTLSRSQHGAEFIYDSARLEGPDRDRIGALTGEPVRRWVAWRKQKM